MNKIQFFRKPKIKDWRLVILISFPALVILFASGFLAASYYSNKSGNEIEANKIPVSNIITADGRLEPKGEIVTLSAPYTMAGSRVKKLKVKRGDYVKAGGIIAILDSFDTMQMALYNAKTQEKVALAKFARVKAGAKQGAIGAKQAAIANLDAELAGEIQTQQATIAKLAAELDNAQSEFQRNQQLYDDGAISASELDSKKLTLRTAQEQLNEARATLERTERTLDAQLAEAQATLAETSEIRPVNLAVAQAELEAAKASVARAKANLELTLVRAPTEGQIIEIHTWPGELVTEGIVDLGQTNIMFALAEVYETDIGTVDLGQKAKITSSALPKPLYGVIEEIGLEVAQKDILNDDPVIAADARVVEVRVLLDETSSKIASKFTNLKVDVTIEL